MQKASILTHFYLIKQAKEVVPLLALNISLKNRDGSLSKVKVSIMRDYTLLLIRLMLMIPPAVGIMTA